MADSRDINLPPNYRPRPDLARPFVRYGPNGRVMDPGVFGQPPPSQPSTTQSPTTQPLIAESTISQRQINNLPDSRDLNLPPNYRPRPDLASGPIIRYGPNGKVMDPRVFGQPPPSQPSTTQSPTTQPLTTEATTSQRQINNLPQRRPNTPTDTSTATSTATKLIFPPGQGPTDFRSKAFRMEDDLMREEIASGMWRVPPVMPPAPADPQTAYTGMRVQQLRILAKMYPDHHTPTAQEKAMMDQAEEGKEETKK